MKYFTKLLSAVAIATLTATPTIAQVIINDPRLPVVVDRNNYCIGNYCYYNPQGLTSKEISGGTFLLLLVYGWFNRRTLAHWWKVEIDKLQQPTKPVKKVSTSRSPKKIEPLPDPLEDLSGGLTQFNKPDPDKIQEIWYVYRQGKPQGPYEKFQLRSFEKITSESKVRRAGEKNWVKAGDVPELADFLE